MADVRQAQQHWQTRVPRRGSQSVAWLPLRRINSNILRFSITFYIPRCHPTPSVGLLWRRGVAQASREAWVAVLRSDFLIEIAFTHFADTAIQCNLQYNFNHEETKTFILLFYLLSGMSNRLACW